MKDIPIIIEEKKDKKSKTKAKTKPKPNPKIKDKISNKKTKNILNEKIVVFGYFVLMLTLIFFLHSLIRWNKYRDFTDVSSKIIEKKASYDDVIKHAGEYNENKYYFWEIAKIKTKKSVGFLRVKTTVKEKNKGLYSRTKQ